MNLIENIRDTYHKEMDNSEDHEIAPVDEYQQFDSPRLSDFDKTQLFEQDKLSDFDGINRPQSELPDKKEKPEKKVHFDEKMEPEVEQSPSDEVGGEKSDNGSSGKPKDEAVKITPSAVEVVHSDVHGDDFAEELKVDILCLLPGRVAKFRRCKGFKVYSMNDFYNYTNVRVDTIFDIHLFSAPYWNHWPMYNQSLVYNAYNPSGGVWINPINVTQHKDLDPKIRREFDFTMIDRFGGSKNFLTSTN